MIKSKETKTIYIRMLEGVETFIPVDAKLMRDNLFEIIANKDMDLKEDATCIYEFFPGDIVKCVLQSDHFLPVLKRRETFLVASKLINSSFPDRKLYQLIFLIVKSRGEIKPEELKEYQSEIKRLCMDNSITQRKHPILMKWIKNVC